MTESVTPILYGECEGRRYYRRPPENLTTYPASCSAAYLPVLCHFLLLLRLRQSSAEFLRDVRDITAISLLGHEYRHSDGDKIPLQIGPVA